MTHGGRFSIFLAKALTALALTPAAWEYATARIGLQLRRTPQARRDRWRVAFVLRELYGLSAPETAEAMGMAGHSSVLWLLKDGPVNLK